VYKVWISVLLFLQHTCRSDLLHGNEELYCQWRYISSGVLCCVIRWKFTNFVQEFEVAASIFMVCDWKMRFLPEEYVAVTDSIFCYRKSWKSVKLSHCPLQNIRWVWRKHLWTLLRLTQSGQLIYKLKCINLGSAYYIAGMPPLLALWGLHFVLVN